jgi:hypothetical protein
MMAASAPVGSPRCRSPRALIGGEAKMPSYFEQLASHFFHHPDNSSRSATNRKAVRRLIEATNLVLGATARGNRGR